MSKRVGRLVLCLALAASSATPLRSQSPNEQLRFEVSSVRPNVTRTGTGRMTAQGDRFTASCVPLVTLIRWAYRPPNRVPIFYDPNLLIGLPVWATDDCFDVQARAETAVPVEQLERMLQSLLEDRFQLKVHRDTREVPIYQLVVASGEHKMKLAEDQTPPGRPKPAEDPSAPPPRGLTNINMEPSGGRMRVLISGTGIAMEQLANRFQGLIGRSVIDNTGLKELFDISLQAFFDPPEATPASDRNAAVSTPAEAAAPGPPAWIESLLFKALEDQLGLKLDRARGLTSILVIEGVQKPSQN
jgi:uncharacterized protein (TIGR03435 family)